MHLQGKCAAVIQTDATAAFNVKRLSRKTAAMNSTTAGISLRPEAHDIVITPEHAVISQLRMRVPQLIVTMSTCQQQVNRDTAVFAEGTFAHIDTTEQYAAATPRDTRQGGFRHSLCQTWCCSEDS